MAGFSDKAPRPPTCTRPQPRFGSQLSLHGRKGGALEAARLLERAKVGAHKALERGLLQEQTTGAGTYSFLVPIVLPPTARNQMRVPLQKE